MAVTVEVTSPSKGPPYFCSCCNKQWASRHSLGCHLKWQQRAAQNTGSAQHRNLETEPPVKRKRTASSQAANRKGKWDPMCEDCGEKHKNYSMPTEQIRRWCGSCAPKHGAILLRWPAAAKASANGGRVARKGGDALGKLAHKAKEMQRRKELLGGGGGGSRGRAGGGRGSHVRAAGGGGSRGRARGRGRSTQKWAPLHIKK